MPHYPEFTDRYSAQYGMLLFSLHFMTNTFFSTFLLPPPISPLPLRFSITHPVHYLHTCCLVGPGLQGLLDFKCNQKQIERYLQSEWQQLSWDLHSSIPSQCNNPLCWLHNHYTKQPIKFGIQNRIDINFYSYFSTHHGAFRLDSIFIHASYICFYCVSHSTPTSFLFDFLFLFHY